MKNPINEECQSLVAWKNGIRWVSYATPDFPTKHRWLDMVFSRELKQTSLLDMPLMGTSGLRFSVVPSSIMGHEVVLFGLYEKPVAKQFSRLISPGDLVVDVGANLGHYTLIAASKTGPTGRVLSIEPVPHLFRQLQRHVQNNELTNVSLVQVALGAENGTIEMTILSDNNDGMHHIATAESTDTISVPQRRLTEVITELAPGREVNLIKIDVEGWEESVFNGSGEIMAQAIPPTIAFESIEEHAQRFGFSAKRLIRRFRDLHYLIFAHHPRSERWYRIDEMPSESECNLIACHKHNPDHLSHFPRSISR